jgi:hypothetical protein
MRYKTRKDMGTKRGSRNPEPLHKMVNRGKRGKKAICHPDQPHWAKGFCKPCYSKNRWETDPEWRERQQKLAKAREQKPLAKATRANYRSQTKEYAKEQTLFNTYRLSKEEWIQIYEYQKGLCPMCGSQLKNRYDETSAGKQAALDHCHATGLVRGLLCQMPCNGALGAFRDKTQWLRNALAYIDGPPATSAFGKAIFTLPGKVGTKKRRASWKKYAAIVDRIKEVGLVEALGAHLQFVDEGAKK